MYKIAIYEDDLNYSKLISELLTEILGKSNFSLNIFSDEVEFGSTFDNSYDLIFMDYYLGSINGFELSKEIRKKNRKAILVFFTSNDTPEPDFFSVDVFRYILKSYDSDRIVNELKGIINFMKKHEVPEIIDIGIKGGITYIDGKDILYANKIKRGSRLVIYDKEENLIKELISTDSLNSIYDRLNSAFFCYPHCSYLVNLRKIDRKKGNFITMLDGNELSISRSKKIEFNTKYIEFSKVRYYI